MSHHISCKTSVISDLSYTRWEMCMHSRVLENKCEISQNISCYAYGKILQEVYQVQVIFSYSRLSLIPCLLYQRPHAQYSDNGDLLFILCHSEQITSIAVICVSCEQIQFGTLNDYFKAVKKSLSKSISTNGTQDVLDTLPTLAGDFFTYADRYVCMSNNGRKSGLVITVTFSLIHSWSYLHCTVSY